MSSDETKFFPNNACSVFREEMNVSITFTAHVQFAVQ